MSDELEYRVYQILDANPEITQRTLAGILGISLGKVNYCLRALIGKGFLKATNFKNAKNRKAYLYKLTPKGIRQKTLVTYEYLRRKADEFDQLREQIEKFRAEEEEGPDAAPET